jgi:SAM-dependent methyltransferase
MHTSSLAHMARLVQTHLGDVGELDVVEIGSQDVNGTYRPMFDKNGWRYRGVDMTAGPNVDIVMPDPYSLPLASRSVDLVLSGQAFEHIEYFWITFLDMVRVLRPNGKIFLIAPSRGPEHRYPVDCWRFYPDGYRALARFARIRLVDVSTDWEPNRAEDSAAWGDTVGVFENPTRGWWSMLGREVTVRGLRAWARGGGAG